MKIATTTVLSSMLLTASTVSAFVPLSPSNNKLSSVIHEVPLNKRASKPTTTTIFSDQTSDNFQEQLQEKADRATRFLLVDVDRIRDDLAQNWGWIVSGGALSIACGVAALSLPILASEVAFTASTFTVAAAGLANLANAFYAEQGHRLKSGLSGALFLGLACYMITHPAEGLDIVTWTIASAIAVEGIYETALAVRNENLQSRGWHLVSGVGSTVAGTWLGLNAPATSLVLPGIALGARLTSNGASKVAIGLEGKKLADQRNQK